MNPKVCVIDLRQGQLSRPAKLCQRLVKPTLVGPEQVGLKIGELPVRQRRMELMNSMYAGDVSCKAAWAELQSASAALVDVRTTREWDVIGVPDLSSIAKEALFEEWQKFPEMAVNANFAAAVDASLQAQGISKDDPVFCLCRSGARSKAAAAALTQLGYTKAYNVIAGFEGDPDPNGERGKVNGWQYDGLPWKEPGSS